jgi:hypothetical protein
MSRPLCQHYHRRGGDLRFQVHRPGNRQAAHRLARRLNPETFTVEDARSKVYALKAIGGRAIAETLRQHKATKVKQGKTVDEIIEERIDWMKTPVRKPDGEMRPRIESWEKFALTTMLRSGELLPIHRDELDTENGTVDIPARRVKKRRVINQPLLILRWRSSRSRWAITTTPSRAAHGGNDVRRAGPVGGRYIALPRPSSEQGRERQAAASGDPQGLQPRHARTVAKKREVLDAWAVELRRIIGEPAAAPNYLLLPDDIFA